MGSTPTSGRGGDVAGGEGVAFPRHDGRRPTTPTARAILADAVRAADRALADRIGSAEKWRSDYSRFVRELTALAGTTSDAALTIARNGLGSMRARMVFERGGV